MNSIANTLDVEYVQHWGDDLMVVNAARVSFDNIKNEVDERDERLINYLAKNKHMSPFEHMGMTLKITCPLYIRSQIMRHRTFSYNEISRRYTDKDLQFYKPDIGDYRLQSQYNKQDSSGNLDEQDQYCCDVIVQKAHSDALKSYNALIAKGVCREQARGVLPQNLVTKFFMTGNLRNWAHFLGLREDKAAQSEVRELSYLIRMELNKHFKLSSKALKEFS